MRTQERQFDVTFTGAGTTTVFKLPFGVLGSRSLWDLTYVGIEVTGGTALNYELQVSEESNLASSERTRYHGASTAVATVTRDVLSQPIPFAVDSDGYLYFKPGFDAGTDNAGHFTLRFRQRAGTLLDENEVTTV